MGQAVNDEHSQRRKLRDNYTHCFKDFCCYFYTFTFCDSSLFGGSLQEAEGAGVDTGQELGEEQAGGRDQEQQPIEEEG